MNSIRRFLLRRVLNLLDQTREFVAESLRRYDVQPKTGANVCFCGAITVNDDFGEGQVYHSVGYAALGVGRRDDAGNPLVDDWNSGVANSQLLAARNYNFVNQGVLSPNLPGLAEANARMAGIRSTETATENMRRLKRESKRKKRAA